MSEYQIFQIPNDLSRRLTRNNTKETRENWFKGYDTIEKRNLERQLPPIPLEPVHPGSERFQEIEFPKTLLIFSGILLICLILTGFQGWLVLSHFGASAFLIESQMRTSNPKLHFMEAIKSQLGYLALGTALLTTVFFLYLVIGDGPRGIPICFDLTSAQTQSALEDYVRVTIEKLKQRSESIDAQRVETIIRHYYPDHRNIANHLEFEFS
jgi:hypothetical protein